MKSSVHSEEDDFVPELHRNVHPRERPDWEETLSTMARGADVPEIPGDLSLKTCGSTASMKVKHVKKPTNPGLMGCDNIHRLPFTKGHFPKMAECAHFHYENVEFGSIQLSLSEEQNEVTKNGCESKELVYLVHIACQGKSWIVKRSYEDFRVLDKHLHLCIYDRRFSQLSELPRSDALKDSPESVTQMLMAYLSRLSAIAGNKINCGPALTWMEIDNKGNHLLVHEESSINTPAVGAAHVIKRYTARAPDELTLEVGDIVSVIDMPPKVLSTWWRGKHGFQVGLFPGHCVELINQKVPQSVTNSVPKPVSKKHGKLITFLRTFMKSRPTKQKLKQRGILKERVFGCDLGEHLLNSGFEVPQVLQSCTAFIERYGIVDGIYRLSGVASNIQRLRHEFDSEHVPDLTKEPYVQDIHSVGSLCKLYFRELPNPLLTYQLYEKFSDAVSAATDEERLIKIHDVIQQLPPPHYRTLEFLMRHLSLLADYCSITNMHAKNLAIVWAPNLLRSKQIESACFSGTAAFMEVRIQSVVVEFILNHVDVLFSGKISAVIQDGAASLSRPKSLLVSSPSTKLLTLEEAQARTQAQVNSPIVTENKYIEVGEGPAALQGKFHTIIEFPLERRRPQNKMKKSPVGSWRSFFNLGKSSSVSKRKLQRNESEPSEMKAMALKGGRAEGTLRSAKSEESLTSLHAVDGDSKLFRPRRPRSSSDALSASFNGEMLGNRCNSYDNLPHDNESEDEVGLLHIPALMSPHAAEDVDLSPPDIGVASLDFDPMSFQCSPPKPESECLESGASFLDSLGYSQEKLSANIKDTEAGGSQSQTPGSTASSEAVSPLQEKLSPFFTLDLSPTEEKSSKPSSFTEKVVYAFSPKIGRKLSKSPSINISEPISVTLPARVSEVIGTVSNTAAPTASSPTWSKSVEDSEAINRSPTQVVKMKTSERDAQGGCECEVQPLEQGAAAEVESPGKEEQVVASSQSKAIPSGQTQTGVDKPHHHPSELADKSPTPSNLPRDKSYPPSGSPEENPSTATMAYMTAAPATAEMSAREASWDVAEQATAADFTTATLQRPLRTNRPLPPPPSQRSAEQLPVMGQVQAAASVGLNNSHKVQVVPAPERPPDPRATDDPAPVLVGDGGAAAQCPVSAPALQPSLPEKVREGARAPPLHLRADSVPVYSSCGFPMPVPPTRTMESKIAAALHSSSADAPSSSGYHPFVPASSASVDDGLPLPLPVPQPKHASQKTTYSTFARPDVTPEPFGPENCVHFSMNPNCQYRPQSVPPHHNKLEQHQVYGARSEPPASMGPRYNTYVAPGRNASGHHSKPCSRVEYVSSLGPTIRSSCYPEDIPPYPTIRRVQSLHAPPSSMIRSVPISRTEVPPDDEPAYCPRPLYQYKPYQSSQARSDYHVTQLQPYFENGRVHYRYSPYSSSSSSYYSPEGALCDVDAYSTVQLKPLHRLPSRDFAFYNPRLQGKHLHTYAGLLPRPRANMTGYFSGNDHSIVNMPPAADVKHTYTSWDLEDVEKYRMQSIRRESRARQKVKGPVMSQYDNMTPAVQDDLGGIYVIHLRSKSDPGKTGLLSVAEGKEGWHPTKVVSPEGEDRFYRKHPEPEFDRAHHHGGYGNGPPEKPTLPQKQSSLRNRKLHDMGCSLPEHRAHQEASHRQLCESKNGPPYPQGAGQLDYGPKGIPDTSEPVSYHNSGGKYITSGQESLRLNHKEVRLSKELERPRARQAPAPEKHSRDCYKEEEHLPPSVVPPPKPERSHSLKLHHTQNVERDPSVLYQYQTHGKRQSSVTVVSQYDNLEGYHSPPQHQRGGFGGGAVGTYVPSGFPHLQNRTYATALGQGAFLPTELSLQHPETQIHAE
ncbi:rho GTPase-activating protein 32 isoform X4 [Meles meles]|uniref:rho GTPase-activating protein 32 isoform X4 n=1 Tax=Meles meles TaxID=9662 RepID=UPI001E6A0E4B|nr:rho GTPase-activating protein 32 isoform X4 [Meles meles]